MSVAVVPLSAALESQWEQYVLQHPVAGIYHALAWRDVTVQALRHEPRYLCALNAAGAIVGVLPLFEVKGFFGRRLVSVPMRDRAGVVADDAEVACALLEAACSLAQEARARYLEIKQVEPMPKSWQGKRNWQLVQSWVTTQVDLTPGVDAIWSGLNRKSLRWSINKARKNGVTVVEDSSLSGMRNFYELFVKTRCRMGIPPFPWELFESIHQNIISTGKGELLLAQCDEKLVHGLVSFYSKSSFVPAYAAPQYLGQKLYANELIFWTFIERAIEKGFTLCDFGADSKKQESLLFFKSRWNGVQRPMHWYYFLPKAGKAPDFDSSGSRYDLVRSIWKKLPLPAARMLGSWITRQLS